MAEGMAADDLRTSKTPINKGLRQKIRPDYAEFCDPGLTLFISPRVIRVHVVTKGKPPAFSIVKESIVVIYVTSSASRAPPWWKNRPSLPQRNQKTLSTARGESFTPSS